MGRDADRRERSEDMLGNAVVDHALAADRAALLRVERGRVVLEVLDERARLRTLIEDLGLALVDLAAASHGSKSLRRQWKGAAAIGERPLVRKVSCDSEANPARPIGFQRGIGSRQEIPEGRAELAGRIAPVASPEHVELAGRMSLDIGEVGGEVK